MTDIELEIALLSDKVALAFEAGDEELMRLYASDIAIAAGLAAEDGQVTRAGALSELAEQVEADADFLYLEYVMTNGGDR
jgi:hypothetical protein